MTKDQNTERTIKEAIAPLLKRISKLEKEVKELKKIKPVVNVYSGNMPNK